MSLFSEAEMQRICDFIGDSENSVLVTFRQKYGPTRLKKIWFKSLEGVINEESCISWWSSAGQMGLLECDTQTGTSVYAQWILGDFNELIGLFEIDEDEVVSIREGFDSANVASSAMRALRIGETGGEKE